MSNIPVARVVRGNTDHRSGGEEVKPSGRVLQLGRRKLPRGLVCRVLFGGPVVAYSWIFAALGMILVMHLLPTIDLRITTYDQEGTATVTRIENTGSPDGGQPTYLVHYTFLDGAGAEHRGASYTTMPPADASRWRVDYRGDEPSESRLYGMKRRPSSALFLLFLLVFPIAGLSFVYSQLGSARRDLRLLRYGVETRGKLVDRRATMLAVEEAPVMALTFEYDVDGARHTATVNTLNPASLEDDALEPMLYDPYAPARATTLDHLPGSPRIAPGGTLEARPGIVVHLLIAPIAFVGALIAAVITVL